MEGPAYLLFIAALLLCVAILMMGQQAQNAKADCAKVQSVETCEFYVR